MQVTVEISLYPLNQSFGPPILSFIKRLRSHKDLVIRSNTMSTQIRGPFEVVMDTLKNELKPAIEADHKSAVVIKIFNEGLDLSWLDIE